MVYEREQIKRKIHFLPEEMKKLKNVEKMCYLKDERTCLYINEKLKPKKEKKKTIKTFEETLTPEQLKIFLENTNYKNYLLNEIKKVEEVPQFM